MLCIQFLLAPGLISCQPLEVRRLVLHKYQIQDFGVSAYGLFQTSRCVRVPAVSRIWRRKLECTTKSNLLEQHCLSFNQFLFFFYAYCSFCSLVISVLISWFLKVLARRFLHAVSRYSLNLTNLGKNDFYSKVN